MLRVVHIYRTYFPDPPGGLQEAIRQICLSTQALGVHNTVFTLSPQPQPSMVARPEAAVIRCRSWAAPASCDLGGVDALCQFRKATQSADIVHYHYPWPFADVMDWVTCPAKAKVMTYHSDVVRQQFLGLLYRPLMKRTLAAMDCVVATSPPYVKTSAVLTQYVQRDRLQVIPLGIDEHSYPQADIAQLPHSMFSLPSDKPFFLFIGVLRYYKGVHTLIEAATQVNAPIVIAGTGPMEGHLREQARQHGAQNVFFVGQISDTEKVALLRKCRALVLPSHLRSEAYGMVLVEAAMFGRAMISCEIGTGTSFVNKHEETGLVVPPEAPQELAQAMNKLLADESLSARFGQAARQRYEGLFSGPALGKAYTQLYREVLNQRS